MVIEICGISDSADTRKAIDNGADWIALDFRKEAVTPINMQPSLSGIIPDTADMEFAVKKEAVRIGIFKDEMPQTVITKIYYYNLDVVQYDGDEGSILIKNMRATIDPDIKKGIKFIKAIKISDTNSFEQCNDFYDCIDYFLFDITATDLHSQLPLIEKYNGNVPFLIYCNFKYEDADSIKNIQHPLFHGVCINKNFDATDSSNWTSLVSRFAATLK